ncbi:MAG: RNA pyrophosphohydrolase [Alphaproteobacteria bacterium]|nr:RNA pyrophosphohydrolase [Alphaproteobacteria bacterium]
MLPYRKCVVIVLRKSSKLFLAERVDVPNAWQLPQGGVENGEDYSDAAKRELFEETSITSVQLVAQTKEVYRYDFPIRLQRKAYRRYGEIKYRGQEQKFILFDFTGEDSEINLQSQTVEFTQWRWASPQDVLDAVVNFKYRCYLQAFREFKLV